MKPSLDLGNIQGNVLAGFNKDHQAFLLLRLPEEQARAKVWLASVLPNVTTHTAVAAFKDLYKQPNGARALSAVWMNLAFTSSGLARLGRRERIGPKPDAFEQGLAKRAELLGHVGESAPSNWLPCFRESGHIDAVVIIAGDRRDDVNDAFVDYTAGVTALGGSVVLALPGDARREETGHEHFGFKDGVSQPGIRGVTKPYDPSVPDKGMPGQDLIEPGEFVIGYQREPRRDEPGNPAPPVPAWTSAGSFLVFQRLTQDVAGFRSSVAWLAAMHGIDEALLGAKFVGRHKSGCALEHHRVLGDVGQTRSDVSKSIPKLLEDRYINDFEFFDDDHSGRFVPRAAHIRKAYPRDDQPPGEDRTQTRRILRRGITFGPSYTDATAGQERGLLFACYQSSIEDQFEFVQRSFADVDFPQRGDGVDPVLIEARDRTTRVPGLTPDTLTIQPFVTMTGGEYFFAPSMRALKMLATP